MRIDKGLREFVMDPDFTSLIIEDVMREKYGSEVGSMETYLSNHLTKHISSALSMGCPKGYKQKVLNKLKDYKFYVVLKVQCVQEKIK
jgi:hypothetical protein